MLSGRGPRGLAPPFELSQADVDVIRHAVVELDADAVESPAGAPLCAPVEDVLLGSSIPAIRAAAGRRKGIRVLIYRSRGGAANQRGHPLRQAGGLHGLARRVLELELHRNGRAALEDA